MELAVFYLIKLFVLLFGFIYTLYSVYFLFHTCDAEQVLTSSYLFKILFGTSFI